MARRAKSPLSGPKPLWAVSLIGQRAYLGIVMAADRDAAEAAAVERFKLSDEQRRFVLALKEL